MIERPSGLLAPYDTGLTLADYSVVIDVDNPYATHAERAKKQFEEFRQKFGDRFEIITVPSSKDKLETALVVEEAMGDRASECVVHPRTGDGGNEGPTRAALGRKTALWISNAGYARNLRREVARWIHEDDIEAFVHQSRVVRANPLFCEVIGPDKEGNPSNEGPVLYRAYLADEFGIGDMAHAQIAREEPKHRQLVKAVDQAETSLDKIKATVKAKRADIRAGNSAIIEAPPFIAQITRKMIGPNGEETILEQYIRECNDLFWSNIGKIALYGNIRDIRLTDPKMVQVISSYKSKRGHMRHYGRLYSIGVWGQDIPDGQAVEVLMHSDSNAQGSGDPFAVPKGSTIRIKRAPKELLVVTTKKRP